MNYQLNIPESMNASLGIDFIHSYVQNKTNIILMDKDLTEIRSMNID